MKRAVCLIVLVLFTTVGAGCAVRRQAPEKPGLVAEGRAYFPFPDGCEGLSVAGGEFETGGALPEDWSAGGDGIEVVHGPDAPQGRGYLRMPTIKDAKLTGPSADAPGGEPLLLSFWWRAESEARCTIYNNAEDHDQDINCSGASQLTLPGTDGEWRRLGLYMRLPTPATNLTFQLRCPKEDPDGEFALDDMRLRSATEQEMSSAWEATRSRMVDYPVPPRQSDGRHLALTVRKLRGGGVPGRPFIVWALGSSWTNFLGRGETLRQMVRRRFPEAPEILYKKHMGGGTGFEFVRGWVRQFAVHDYPDLILIYTNGKAEALDETLSIIRSSCTADIIIAPVHFWENSKDNWDEHVDTRYWDRIREVCREHGVEYVENRRELAAWFEDAGTGPLDVLSDGVHQNRLGRLLINLNFTRHLAVPDAFAYRPERRERRVSAAWALRGSSALVQAVGGWELTEDGAASTDEGGAKLSLSFRGNRVDLLGRRRPGGGSVQVRIDGKPAQDYPAFATNFVRPHRDNRSPGGDAAPHAVELGENIVPQEWTITMTSDDGDYELVGSKTGQDGRGNNREDFVSDSGQIIIDPELWRGARGNKEGDAFTFRVYRCTAGRVQFDGVDGDLLHRRLGQNLDNGEHTLELEAVGDGSVTVDSFYVFQPPGE